LRATHERRATGVIAHAKKMRRHGIFIGLLDSLASHLAYFLF